MRFRPIYDIAELCVKKGLTEAVLCPGSRCAPLTLAFTRHRGINTRTFSDERSAGFIALGMAQRSGKPVVTICTSGTAVYNLAPSVAEAFFSQTPLIILTADRPAEWIAQHDGQTIYQTEVFGKHVKKYFQLPQDYDHPDSQWAINRIVNEAINLSRQEPQGPVHVNAPFREPLYPDKGETVSFSSDVRIMEDHPSYFHLSDDQKEKIKKEFPSYHNVLIVAGQQSPDPGLSKLLADFSRRSQTPVVTDIISNLNDLDKCIRHADLFLGQAPEQLKQELRPDLIITFGQSLISKNTKLFLRKFKPRAHWHLQAGGAVADPFKSITDIFQPSPFSFFSFLSSLAGPVPEKEQTRYYQRWEAEETRTQQSLHDFLQQQGTGELMLVNAVLDKLPGGSNLHLANSMSVRYANFIGLRASERAIRVFANRGTSGIDGSTSTSVGHYLASGKPTFLITGDLAFFYDRNAFWHNYAIPDLRVLLLNNHGGLIFNVIDGPASLPEAQEYFITRQTLTAKKLCEEFGFDYLTASSTKKINDQLKDFFAFDKKTKILELETEGEQSKAIFNDLKLKIKKNYEL